jgi:sigma-B regulation protein RsbU (phosphoserine phosphatase)
MSRDLRPWLEKREFNLETVESAQACLSLLESTADDVILVISDLRMPGMKGSELIQRISHRYPDVGLVLLTAYSDMEDITKAVSSDIYGLIIKPWDVKRLTAELDRMVTRVLNERRRNRREYELESQLKIAGEFQYRFFEPPVPLTHHFDIEVSNRPAPGIYVTGDYYEVIPLGERRVLFLLGDSAGHGVKSAFIATTVKAIIDEFTDRILSKDFEIGRFLGELNARVLDRLSTTSEVIISFSAVLVDIDAGILQSAGGGNPPICLIRSGEVVTIPTDSPALGCSADVTYEPVTVEVLPGDRLVMFTDGVYDRGTAEAVSWEMLSRVFVQAHGASPFIPQVERILGAMDVLETTEEETEHRDDLTILSARIRDTHGKS